MGPLRVPLRRRARGFRDPLRPCGPSLRPPQGPEVHILKMLTLRRGNAAARAVIGPLSQTRGRTVILALRRRGAMFSSLDRPMLTELCLHLSTR